jgi:hypothetical protein
MNEQRQEAYLNLIQSLLSLRSNNKKIQEILSANQDLLDADFLRVIEVVSEVKSESGQENTANWLRFLKNQLAESLNLKFEDSPQVEKRTSEEEDLKDYFKFLLEVLYATFKSNGDTKIIYPLLAANVDKLENNLVKICHCLRSIFEEEAEIAEFFVEIMGEFGTLISQFPLGDKASNIEIAIACYETVIKMRNRQACSQEWVITQINLSNAYRSRIIGNKAENIENAALLNHGMVLPDFEETINSIRHWFIPNLCNAENAIAASKDTLQVYNCQDFPLYWAKTQNYLGNAYIKRICGDQADNIENAIVYFTAALTVYTKDTLPLYWAKTQDYLGNAYIKRIRGDKTENIEIFAASAAAASIVETQETSDTLFQIGQKPKMILKMPLRL